MFVEDTAVVFDELAVIARPGAASRRRKWTRWPRRCGRYRRLAFIEAPGTLDGGDVLVTPAKCLRRHLRTHQRRRRAQLASHIAPFGFEVIPVPVDWLSAFEMRSHRLAASALRRKSIFRLKPEATYV